MRKRYAGQIAVEVRHTTWASSEVRALLDEYLIDPVLADPAIVWNAGDFAGPPRYVRLHGKPKIYYSSYSNAEIHDFLRQMSDDSWCIFDNTASGAAAVDALTMLDALASSSVS